MIITIYITSPIARYLHIEHSIRYANNKNPEKILPIFHLSLLIRNSENTCKDLNFYYNKQISKAIVQRSSIIGGIIHELQNWNWNWNRICIVAVATNENRWLFANNLIDTLSAERNWAQIPQTIKLKLFTF